MSIPLHGGSSSWRRVTKSGQLTTTGQPALAAFRFLHRFTRLKRLYSGQILKSGLPQHGWLEDCSSSELKEK
jgi:hypothetical protein